MNQIVNMVLRRIMRQLVNRGVDAGINAVATKKGGNAKNSHKQDMKRAKQSMRMVRRVSKF